MPGKFAKAPSAMALWPHQRAAVDLVVEHLNKAGGPCLIRMPTGTGKTGVIATLAVLCTTGRALVITPWTNLRDQVIRSVQGGFWAQIAFTDPRPKVVELFPKTVEDVLKDSTTKVMVCSFTALNDIRRDRTIDYDKLAAFIDLVIVDEGHYEPAVEWGRSVKGLHAPTVLLTATPYRNDQKLFRIRNANEAIFQFSHEDAEAKKIIREVRFEQLDCEASLGSLTQSFIDYWTKAKRDGALPSPGARAIVCCHDAQDIETSVNLLLAAGLEAIGIHETFSKKGNPKLLVDVPDPSTTNAEIWVHQRKLMEGLDDFRFSCVAVFAPFRNDRKLIQQIGRILRAHSSDRPRTPALVLSPKQYEVESRWLAYRDFDRDPNVRDAEYFRNTVMNLLKLQPEIEYFEGRFRRRFDPSALGVDPQVAIAPSVLVRVIGPTFSLAEYIDQCTDTLNLEDAVILGPNRDAPCIEGTDYALWVYASVSNSRLLASTSLYEISLQVHCAVMASGFLLVSDTKGIYPEAILEDATTGLSPGQLSALLDSRFRVTNVSLTSAVPFDTVPRGADLRGHDIAGIAASLTDRIQICRSARGSSLAAGRRYVGMNRGRVRKEISEDERQRHTLDQFLAWARDVANTIATRPQPNAVFSRFMQSCTPPANPEPKVISLHLDQEGVSLLNSEGRAVEPVSSSVNFCANTLGAPTHEFTIEFKLKGTAVTRTVKQAIEAEFQKARNRFWFKSTKESPIRVEEPYRHKIVSKSFADYLNRNQSIVLIGLAGGEVIYQGGDFYEIDYSSAERTLLSRISPLPVPACGTEKGTKMQLAKAKGKAQKFIKGSLFRLISTDPACWPFDPELIVCDDLNSECADFVFANFTDRRLALMHAKVGDGSGISASAFHDVVSQAMKNLAYLTRNASTPKGARSWANDVFWNKTKIPRLLKGPAGLSRTAIWNTIRSDIIDTANARLEVVLVTAGCCDVTKLYEAVTDKSKRTAETAQLLHLLESLNSFARTLGVQMSVYDIPYLAPP